MENRSEGRFDEVWNLETMFSQLAKRSTRMQVKWYLQTAEDPRYCSLCFEQILGRLGMFYYSDAVYGVSISWNYILLRVTNNFGLGKWAKIERNDGKVLRVKTSPSIEECTRENGESLKQYTRIVLATEIFSWSCQVWLPAPKFSLTYQPPLIGVKIKRKVIFDSCLNESRFFFSFSFVSWLSSARKYTASFWDL